jgi:hypothetical protein
MVDNIDQIKKLLKFKDSSMFYRLYIFKRKKDQATDRANHQSVRTVKAYSIYNLEYLDNKYEEIKHLCEHFKARAYISTQQLSDKQVSLQMMKGLVTNLESGKAKCEHLYNSVVGKMHSKVKRWVVDIDTTDKNYINEVVCTIEQLPPLGTQKVLEIVPTLQGVHLITSPFREDWFKSKYADIDIQKCNPTVLYIPNSIINVQRD